MGDKKMDDKLSDRSLTNRSLTNLMAAYCGLTVMVGCTV